MNDEVAVEEVKKILKCMRNPSADVDSESSGPPAGTVDTQAEADWDLQAKLNLLMRFLFEYVHFRMSLSDVQASANTNDEHYLHSGGSSENSIFHTVFDVFFRLVLLTTGSSHVQSLVFYLASQNPVRYHFHNHN